MKTFTISDEINPITVECDDDGVPRSASVHWLNNLDLGRLSDPRCQLPPGLAWSKATSFSAVVVRVQPQNHDEYLACIADQHEDMKDWQWSRGDVSL